MSEIRQRPRFEIPRLEGDPALDQSIPEPISLVEMDQIDQSIREPISLVEIDQIDQIVQRMLDVELEQRLREFISHVERNVASEFISLVERNVARLERE